MSKTKIRYLLNITFYAGSDDAEDIDRGLYLIAFDNPVTFEEITEMFQKVNKLLDVFDGKCNNFPLSYETGINIDTLMEGVAIYSNAKVETIEHGYGKIESIDGVYFLEQWQ